MSFLENSWFKVRKVTEEQMNEDADRLQKIIDEKISQHQKHYQLLAENGDAYKASKIADDQELNNAGLASIMNKDLEEAPLIAHETELKMKIKKDIKDESIDSNYATKN